MSRKDERVAELELERVSLRAELRERDQERAVFVAMLLRAAREMREPLLRASFIEEIEVLVPGTVEELSADQRPDTLRKRGARR